MWNRAAAGDARRVIEVCLVLLTGVAAGILNAVGGGTFVALPSLVAFGLQPVTANAVSRAALVPGVVASAWVCRREVVRVGPASTKALTGVSGAGGGVGAGLLLVLPASSFDAAVCRGCSPSPPRCSPSAGSFPARWPGRSAGPSAWAREASCAVSSSSPCTADTSAEARAMTALWSIGLGLDAAVSNPMRITQLAAVYLSAAVLFLVASDALSTSLLLTVMLAGAVAGGFAGAHLARHLPARLLRGCLLTTAVITTVLYFLRG
ncbi:sulfite exporter TauE/SafE family protein [Streptomyces sp. NPDC127039]|uniref:sulfite exporter TauE/SafE family protein n=1 Tax=Streptomyces sp. NPDC127039 TaxID=3347115 RepID=UPI0036587C8F